MPFIQSITPPTHRNRNAVIRLHKEGLIIDPRCIIPLVWRCSPRIESAFECIINERMLTVTRRRGGYNSEILTSKIYFRIYDPAIEDVPAFDSTVYKYHGLENEKAPITVRHVIVEHARVIRKYAFAGCRLMKTCTLNNEIYYIKKSAFEDCVTLKYIRLPRELQYIGDCVFNNCSNLESLFFPRTLAALGHHSMECCESMKLLVVHNTLHFKDIGKRVVGYCDGILAYLPSGYDRPPTLPYSDNQISYRELNREVNRSLQEINMIHPVLRLLADPNVDSDEVDDYIRYKGTIEFFYGNLEHAITPLHVVVRYNPFVDKDVIMRCFTANPSAIVFKDNENMSPIDYLWMMDDNKFDVIVGMIVLLCTRWRRTTNTGMTLVSTDPHGESLIWEHRDHRWNLTRRNYDPYDRRT